MFCVIEREIHACQIFVCMKREKMNVFHARRDIACSKRFWVRGEWISDTRSSFYTHFAMRLCYFFSFLVIDFHLSATAVRVCGVYCSLGTAEIPTTERKMVPHAITVIITRSGWERTAQEETTPRKNQDYSHVHNFLSYYILSVRIHIVLQIFSLSQDLIKCM